MNKIISVKWSKNRLKEYEMKVIESTHPIFRIGSRFDFGFFEIATRDGYQIISYPSDNSPNKDKGFLVSL